MPISILFVGTIYFHNITNKLVKKLRSGKNWDDAGNFASSQKCRVLLSYCHSTKLLSGNEKSDFIRFGGSIT